MINYTRFKALSIKYADSFYVNLQCRTADTALFRHNGSPWNNLGFQPFPYDASYSYARVNIKEGEHSISNPNGFTGIYYAMTLDLPFNSNFANPEHRFEDYAHALGGIIPMDTIVRGFQYSTDGQTFQDFDSGNPTLCIDEPLYLLAEDAHQLSWQWDFGNGTQTAQAVEEERPDTLVVHYSAPGNYTVQATQQKWACVANASLQVNVVQAGPLAFDVETSAGCEGRILRAKTTNEKYDQYQWLLNGELIGESSVLTYNVSQAQGETVVLTLLAQNDFCSDTATEMVQLTTDRNGLQVPNVFSPNGDGINDCFRINNSEGYQDCFELKVFNRWGIEVFSTKDPLQCWAAEGLADGVYFYLLQLGQERMEGTVTLFSED